MSFGNRTCQALLNSFFGNTSSFGALASAPTIYAALSSTVVAEDGTNFTEHTIGNNGYARVLTSNSDWNAATLANPSVVTNANPITFNQATGDWLSAANMVDMVLMDASTAGNYLGRGALAVAKAVENGDTPSFAAGKVTVDLA